VSPQLPELALANARGGLFAPGLQGLRRLREALLPRIGRPVALQVREQGIDLLGAEAGETFVDVRQTL
jgi:hypothetical protein